MVTTVYQVVWTKRSQNETYNDTEGHTNTTEAPDRGPNERADETFE